MVRVLLTIWIVKLSVLVLRVFGQAHTHVPGIIAHAVHPGIIGAVRRRGFIDTSLIGPLLITNPHFTRSLLTQFDPDSEPVLAHEQLALAAYEARLDDFRERKRWHPVERVASRRQLSRR